MNLLYACEELSSYPQLLKGQNLMSDYSVVYITRKSFLNLSSRKLQILTLHCTFSTILNSLHPANAVSFMDDGYI